MKSNLVSRARFLAAGILAWAVASGAGAPRLDVGKPFPAMTFPDLDGQPKSIADFLGKKTVLHLFASW